LSELDIELWADDIVRYYCVRSKISLYNPRRLCVWKDRKHHTGNCQLNGADRLLFDWSVTVWTSTTENETNIKCFCYSKWAPKYLAYIFESLASISRFLSSDFTAQFRKFHCEGVKT